MVEISSSGSGEGPGRQRPGLLDRRQGTKPEPRSEIWIGAFVRGPRAILPRWKDLVKPARSVLDKFSDLGSGLDAWCLGVDCERSARSPVDGPATNYDS